MYVPASSNATMTEEQNDLVSAGVMLFEVRQAIGKNNRQQFFNLFDASVKFNQIGTQLVPEINYRTSNDACVVIEADKNGIGLGFIPDDPWWHNRLVLLGDKNWNVVALHTKHGTIEGDKVRRELQLLEDRLYYQKPCFEIHKNGKFEKYFWTKQECEDEIETLSTAAILPTYNKTTGAIAGGSVKKEKYTIVPSSRRAPKDLIQQLINKYKRNSHGWTNCREFEDIQREMIPAIEQVRNSDSRPSAPSREDFKDMIAQMPKEDIISLLKGALSSDAKTEKENEGDELKDDALSTNVRYKITHLRRAKVERLAALGVAYGIDITSLDKTEMADAIFQKQEEKFEAGAPAGGSAREVNVG